MNAYIKIYRIQSFQKESEWRASYQKLDDALKKTSSYHYYMASLFSQPIQKEMHLSEAIRIGGKLSLNARASLAKILARRGQLAKAVPDMISLINETRFESNSLLASMAATVIVEEWSELDPYEQLIVQLTGCSGLRGNEFGRIFALAHENNWKSLALYCSHRAVELEENNGSANNNGRARAALELRSLAFQSFSRAAELGASVGLCNMASMHLNESVPAAGLKILGGHSGAFDAMDRGFPYSILAELERKVQDEEKLEKEILERGERQFEALWTLAAKAIGHLKESVQQSSGKLVGHLLALNVAAGEIVENPALGLFTVPIRPFEGFFKRVESGDAEGFVLLSGQDFLGIEFSD